MSAAANSQMEQIKSVYDDGKAEINERTYEFTVMTFVERRSVFAYMSSIKPLLMVEDFSFLDTPKFKEIERDIINKRVTVEGMTIAKTNIFEEHPEDYIMFIATALMVISYPFLNVKLG